MRQLNSGCKEGYCPDSNLIGLHLHRPSAKQDTRRASMAIGPSYIKYCKLVITCPLTKVEGGLNLLHKVDDDTVIWLESTVTAAFAK